MSIAQLTTCLDIDLFLGTSSFSRGKTSKLCEYRSFGPSLMVWPLFIDSKNSETSSHQTPPSSGESANHRFLSRGRAGCRPLQSALRLGGRRRNDLPCRVFP